MLQETLDVSSGFFTGLLESLRNYEISISSGEFYELLIPSKDFSNAFSMDS